MDVKRLFQFLLGRLETGEVSSLLADLFAFQFLLGRLETDSYRIPKARSGNVSIPLR